MNKFNGYIALFVVFFVVFLGMRNPWLDNTPGPKRKGRAVISYNTFSKHLADSFDKTCKDHNPATPVATLLAAQNTWNAPFTASPLVFGEQTVTSLLYLHIRSSRAPPAPLS